MSPANQTLLIQMSPDELRLLVIDYLHSVLQYGNDNTLADTTKSAKQFVYGLNGLSKLLNCSHPTAQRIKDSGKIPYTQVGRKLIFDSDEVLKALNRKK